MDNVRENRFLSEVGLIPTPAFGGFTSFPPGGHWPPILVVFMEWERKDSLIKLRIEPSLKEQFQLVCTKKGHTISDELHIYISDMVDKYGVENNGRVD